MNNNEYYITNKLSTKNLKMITLISVKICHYNSHYK